MSERKILIGSNWKMNKTVSEAISYTRRLLQEIEPFAGLDQLQIFVIPPYTAIAAVKHESGGRLWVGAQNMHWAESGAYTGEISAPMLKELHVDLVELGHAERRQHFGETDATINRKLHMALRFGLRALICIGEQLEQKVSGVERESLTRQLRAILAGVPAREASKLILAYEPVWAIGEDGTTADPQYVRVMCDYIRSVVAEAFGLDLARQVRVIYGGDVKASNAAEILGQGGVDGLFIGRAAWQVEGFVSLIRACLEPLAPGARKH
jgi:L-erythrulose 1-phosphate isomerase